MACIAVAGLLVLLGSGRAQAQIPTLAADDLADVQCFALFAVMVGSAGIDAEAVSAGEAEGEEAVMLMGLSAGMMYHLGRLEGRSPDTDWLVRISNYVESIEIADLEPASQRCAKSLSDTGESLVAWGGRLQKQ